MPGERLRRAVHSEDAELALRTGRRRANERMSGVNVDVKDKKDDWGFPTRYTTCATMMMMMMMMMIIPIIIHCARKLVSFS